MMAIHARANRSRGFTLIELLVVVAILGVLATLIISVGSYVRTRQLEDSTKNTLRLIKLSVDVYKEAKNSYPGLDQSDSTPKFRSMRLYGKLAGSPADNLLGVTKAREALSNLPKENFESQVDSRDGKTRTVFVDSFGTEIDYLLDQGAGGTPVLVSSGQDTIPGYTYAYNSATGRWELTPGNPPTGMADNIRSDGR